MPPTGIPSATRAQRAAYRKAQAELQGRPQTELESLRARRARRVNDLLIELNRMAVGDPWSIDEHGCLTRTIGG